MTLNKTDLLQEMERLLEAGDREALKDFIVKHFQEFPEEAQGKIFMSLFGEAVDSEIARTGIAELQKEGINAAEKIAEIKTQIEAMQAGK